MTSPDETSRPEGGDPAAEVADENEAVGEMLAERGLTYPATVAGMFFSALQDREVHLDALGNIVTPESRRAWGDFSQVAQLFGGYADPGTEVRGFLAEGAPDVAYVGIIEGVADPDISADDVVVPVGVFTLVWRPEAGMWLIHSFGDPIPAEFLPRSSPGDAPALD